MKNPQTCKYGQTARGAGLLVFLFGCVSLAVADDIVPVSNGKHGTIVNVGDSGDSPPTTSFTFSGNVGVEIDVVPFDSSPAPSTFVLSGIPSGSSILKALMYVQRWNSPTTNATTVFSGNALGPIAPFAVDPAGGLQLQSYRFDVTSFVTGNASFPFSFTTGGGQNFYAALVVIFSNSSEPVRTILINDGSEAIGTGSSTTTFGGLSAGSGTLTIVTQADNPSGGGESILFNGSTILGPGDIFNANLGPFASLFQLPVTALAGTNTAGVTTFDDLFGWHLAILAVQAAITCPPDETIISGDPDGDGRVTICHIPPGNPDNTRTITISVRALPAHLAHGDLCGPCEEDDGLLLMAGESEVCSADVNGDGAVGPFDLAIVLGSWGPCEGCPTDFNGDNVVDAFDLAQVLGAWGACS